MGQYNQLAPAAQGGEGKTLNHLPLLSNLLSTAERLISKSVRVKRMTGEGVTFIIYFCPPSSRGQALCGKKWYFSRTRRHGPSFSIAWPMPTEGVSNQTGPDNGGVGSGEGNLRGNCGFYHIPLARASCAGLKGRLQKTWFLKPRPAGLFTSCEPFFTPSIYGLGGVGSGRGTSGATAPKVPLPDSPP